MTQNETISWPQLQYDAGHTGDHPDATGPKQAVEIDWQFDTGGEVQADSYALSNGTLFVESTNDKVTAIDATTGQEQWSFSGSDIFNQCPAVVDGSVFAGSDSTLYAFTADTGEVEWEFGHSDALSSPTVAGGTVYIISFGDLYAVNSSTGEQEWQTGVDGSGLSRTPTVGGGNVYAGTGNDNEVYAFDKDSGSVQWSLTVDDDVFAPPAYSDGAVYFKPLSVLYAVDAQTGDIIWEKDIGGRAGSPTVTNDTIYVSGNSGIHALDVATGDEQWTNSEFFKTTILNYADGVLYTGDIGAIDAETGESLWSYSIPDTHYGAPVPAGDYIYMGSYNGNMYALKVSYDVSVSATGETISTGGEATITIDAPNIDTVTLSKLWTDWDVTGRVLDGGSASDTVAGQGTFEITWSEIQDAISLSISVSPPERYTGGTYRIDVTVTNTDGDSASTTATLNIQDGS